MTPEEYLEKLNRLLQKRIEREKKAVKEILDILSRFDYFTGERILKEVQETFLSKTRLVRRLRD